MFKEHGYHSIIAGKIFHRFPFQETSKHLKGRFGPVLVTVTFWDQRRSVLGPVLVTVTFLDQRRSVWAPC